MIGRWPGWRCTTTRSTRSTRTPSTDSPSRWKSRHSPPCFPSFSAFTTFLVESQQFNGKWNISCFFIGLGSAVQWKSFEPYPALCESLSVSPTRLLFHSSPAARQPTTFLDFPAQNFLPQFTLLTVSGSPQRSRLSELLTVCCGCFRKKSVALEFRLRFKLFPVRLVNVLERGNPLIEKVKFNPSVQLVIWNNEQGISYHKLYQKNEWVCQKFWGLINQHLPTCTSLRNRRTVWTLNNCII